jgi:N-acetylglucosaminyl-diphospho-decaprenol L-rhamnosyltransferase
MFIAAIVLDYRGASKTEKCLKSLVGEGIGCCIVVDNSDSADHTKELENSLDRVRALGCDFPILHLVSSSNLGFAKGVNSALRDSRVAGRYSYFLLLNNDATMVPGALLKMVKALEADPRLPAVAPLIVSGTGITQRTVWYNRYLGSIGRHKTLLSFPYLSGCCLLFRPALLADGKLLDDSFFMYGEDVLLGWRLFRSNQMVRCIDDAMVNHEGSGSSQITSLFYETHVARGHVLLATKTYLWRGEVPIMLVCKGLFLFARALVRAIRYRSLVPLKALGLAWLPTTSIGPGSPL